MTETQVGRSVRKLDGRGLVTGRARYTDDEHPAGLLHAAVLRSPHAHARLRAVDTRAAKKLPGVHAVLTWRDLPRIPITTAGQGCPEPSPLDSFILDHTVRFAGDRVAAVAAETEAIARAACALIRVDYELLPPVTTVAAALADGAPVIHPEPEATALVPLGFAPQRNSAAHAAMDSGDVDAGLAAAAVTLDAVYDTHRIAHAALELHAAIAWLDADGRLVIRCSTQVPFHVRRIVARALNLPVARIRVIKPRVGGGFGGKQEIITEDIAAALALATRRPVRFVLSRAEQFRSARTRHAMHLRVRAGLAADGTLTALDLGILMDSGAYGAHAFTALCNAGNKVLPLWRTPAVRFRGTSAYTTLPVGGAARGYGAPQGHFAVGCALDELAEQAGIDPADFIRRNHVRDGDSSPVFRDLGELGEGHDQPIVACGLPACLDAVLAACDWQAKRTQYLCERDGSARWKRGLGLVALMQGSGIPNIDLGAVSLKLNEDGSLNLLLGATDVGNGSDTVMAQLVAQELAIPTEQVIPYSSDTDLTPFDAGAYASSTTYVSGMAAVKAARAVKEQVLTAGADLLGLPVSAVQYADGAVYGGGRTLTLAEIARITLYGEQQRQIAAHASHCAAQSPPPFAAHVAEIELDTLTGIIRVLHYWSATDCGTVVNPALARGQVEGSIAMGLGFALSEEYLLDARGSMRNASFSWYRIPGMRDVPPLTTLLVAGHEPSGPHGAKSIGEISTSGPAPALANAVACACGFRLRALPFTPPRVWQALR